VILAGETRTLDGVDNTTQDDGASALDVIIEAGVQTLIPLERREGVLEILELDDDTNKLPLAAVDHPRGCV
jgi:hypothetical protein